MDLSPLLNRGKTVANFHVDRTFDTDKERLIIFVSEGTIPWPASFKSLGLTPSGPVVLDGSTPLIKSEISSSVANIFSMSRGKSWSTGSWAFVSSILVYKKKLLNSLAFSLLSVIYWLLTFSAG